MATPSQSKFEERIENQTRLRIFSCSSRNILASFPLRNGNQEVQIKNGEVFKEFRWHANAIEWEN